MQWQLRIGYRRRFIAGGDKLFQSKLVEIEHEIAKEIALERIVAVAINNLATENIRAVFQIRLDFFLNIAVLGIKFVVFYPFCVCKIFVCHNYFSSRCDLSGLICVYLIKLGSTPSLKFGLL